MIFLKRILVLSLFYILVSCVSNSNKNENASHCSKYNSEEGANTLVSCLRAYPIADISQNQKVAKYLKKHKVYVSLTTSPERIKHIPTVLKTVDLNLVSQIFVTLPKKFKNVQEYPNPLPKELVNFPKVTFLHPDNDLGPITKMLFAIEHVKKMDPKSIVISVDDDTAYPIGIFAELVRYLIVHDAKVVGSRGAGVGTMKSKKLNFQNKCDVQGYCEIVEGYGAIAYVVGAIPTDLMKTYAEADKNCRVGDDMVINYALQHRGIDRFKFNTPDTDGIVQLYYGFGEDALHKYNDASSYQKCIDKMDEI